MKDKIGFITIGQAGGNIGVKLEELGYDVFFMNTSQEDLDTLTSAKFKHHIKNGEGCNKDRNKAKDLIIENFEEISEEIKSKIKKQFIYVIFSSGGGTGSGASPMLIDLLIQDGQTVGAITIIPGDKEPTKTHINAYECFKELNEIDGLASTIILDNNSCDNRLSINKDFVELLDLMLDMPNHKDIRGNIDKAEVMEMLKTRGMLTITKVEKEDTSIANIVETFKNNIYAPIENDKVIIYLGILAAKPIEVNELKKEIGNYIDSFQGYSEKESVCVLSGLKIPVTRLNKMKESVLENQEDIKKNISAARINSLDENINFLDAIATEPKKSVQSFSKSDIFAKYRKK